MKPKEPTIVFGSKLGAFAKRVLNAEKAKKPLTGPFWIVWTKAEWEAQGGTTRKGTAQLRKGQVHMKAHIVGDWVICASLGATSMEAQVARYLGPGQVGVGNDGGGEEPCILNADLSCTKNTCAQNCCPGTDVLGHAICSCIKDPCPGAIVIGHHKIFLKPQHHFSNGDPATFVFEEGGHAIATDLRASVNVVPITIGSARAPRHAGNSVPRVLKLVNPRKPGKLVVRCPLHADMRAEIAISK